MGRGKNRFARTTVAICVNVLKEKNKLEKSILSWTAATTTAKTVKKVHLGHHSSNTTGTQSHEHIYFPTFHSQVETN